MNKVPKAIIQEIAGQLQAGFCCFLHKETLELVSFPHEDDFASVEPGIWKEEIQAVKKGRQAYLQIQGMETGDSFRVMEEFAQTIKDTALKEKLLRTLNQKRPFAHFKADIDHSGPYRERWFRFRDEKMIQWVEEQLR